MGLLDAVSKVILNQGPAELIRLACPTLHLSSVTSLEKEIVNLQRNADKLFRLNRGADLEPIDLHIEVMSGWESDLPQRMHEYWALFSPKHPQLDSLLIVLQDHPSKGTPRSCYQTTTPLGRTLRFEFHLLCLWQIEAAELEALNSVVLLPLLPFTKGAGLEAIYKAFERIDALEEDRQKREIRAGMVGTARLKFGDIDWLGHIGGKAALMGTDLYEEIVQEVAEKERRALLETMLRARFGDGIRPLLSNLGSLNSDTLLELATKIATIRDDQAFLNELRQVLSSR